MSMALPLGRLPYFPCTVRLAAHFLPMQSVFGSSCGWRLGAGNRQRLRPNQVFKKERLSA